jgi:hypothetical protein
MDVAGPDPTAYQELYEQIVRLKPDLARGTVFLCGSSESEATRHWLAASGQPLVLKPFTPDELVRAVARLAPAYAPVGAS